MRVGTVARFCVWTLMTVFFLIPVAYIGWRGMTGFAWTALHNVPTILLSTLSQALWSTGVAVLIALPIAWALTVLPGRAADWVLLWVAVPFIVPTPVAAVMVQAVCGPQSWCGHSFAVEVAQGFAYVVVVQAWYNIGILVRLIVPAWAGLRGRYLPAAATLSASPWRQVRTLTAPLLLPSTVNGALMVLLYCIGSFGVIVLLGGGRMVSLEVEIWRQTSQYLRLDIATVLAVLQLAISVVVLSVVDRIAVPTPFADRAARTPPVRGLTRVWAVSIIIGTLLIFVVPYFSLVDRAGGGSDQWASFRALQLPVRGSGINRSPLESLVRSLWIAGVVTVLTMVIAWVATTPRTRLRTVVVMPLAVSTITLGLGYILWFGSLGWLTAPWILIAVHTVVALPLVSRQLMLARDRLPQHYAAAAQTLGAPPWRTVLQIEVPLLRRALTSAASLAYALSLGDYAAALVLTRPDSATAPVVIARLLNRPGATNYAQAAALSVVFVVCCVCVMAIVQQANAEPEG